MFAVIKTGGKQYKVQLGDVLQVEKLGADKDKTFTFKEVLLVEDGKNTLAGTPFADKAVVRAVVVENFKDKKVIVFKKKRRKQYKRTRGHRQELTEVRIEEIAVGAAVKKAKPVEPKKETKPKAEPKKVKAPAAKPEKAKKAAPAKPEKAAKKPAAKKPAVKKAAAPKPAEAKKTAPPVKEKKAAAPKAKAEKPAASKAKPKAAPKKKADAKAPSKTKKATKTKEK